MPEPQRPGGDGGRDPGLHLSAEDAGLLLELYEDAPCGYLSTDPGGSITRVNRTLERLVGRSREVLLGSAFADLLTRGGQVYHETHYAPLLSMQGEVREIALEMVHADGTPLPVLINAQVCGDGIRTTVFDARDRREYERELVLARRRAERLQEHSGFLAEAARRLGEVRGVTPRARRLAELLVPGSADAAVVATADPVTFVASAGGGGEDKELASVVEAAIATGGARLGNRGVEDGRSDALAALPLLLGDRVIGAIGLARTRRVDPFAAADLELLGDLADRAALALENARLYEYEHRVAHTLQRSMLAGDPPHHPRCAIGTFYSPAVTTLDVGGDWHDAFFLGPDRLAFVVGDVVGRGLDAATAMGQLRSAVRALAGTGLGPAGVLENLDAFAERAADTRGATVVYAELDLQSGRLAMACAGHPPPLLASPHGEPELLWGGRSTPLGADFSNGGPRPQVEIDIERGSRLLLYTDGLVERRDQALDVGLEELGRAFAHTRSTPVGEVGAALSAAIPADGHRDDVCLLTVAFGSDEPFELELPADLRELRPLRRTLTTWLEGRGVTGSDRDAVVLACSETAANAIEHGYRGGTGAISVIADTAPGEITVAVSDRGAWRIPVVGGRAGRGRGLLIVETLMDQVMMDRGRGTRVTMRRRLREPGHA